jgi:hypothetical protein
MSTHMNIRLHIICRDLPGATFENYRDVRLGIQRGREVVAEVSGAAERTEFDIELQFDAASSSWRGPFVHGPKGTKFLYLCWTAQHDENREMFRRAKIHLTTIPRELLQAALSEDRVLQLELGLTDSKGGPLCASVAAEKLSWSLAAQSK